MSHGHETTFWNGERTPARRVVIVVGDAEFPAYWARHLVGQERHAVEVTYHAGTFYMDDDIGNAWHKVTAGMGSPRYGHRELRAARVVREVASNEPCRCGAIDERGVRA